MTAASDSSARVIRRMRALRLIHAWSAQKLADQMVMAGVPWTRSIVANIENGRRSNITLDELFTLADVFGVDPLALVDPGEGVLLELVEVVVTRLEGLK